MATFYKSFGDSIYHLNDTNDIVSKSVESDEYLSQLEAAANGENKKNGIDLLPKNAVYILKHLYRELYDALQTKTFNNFDEVVKEIEKTKNSKNEVLINEILDAVRGVENTKTKENLEVGDYVFWNVPPKWEKSLKITRVDGDVAFVEGKKATFRLKDLVFDESKKIVEPEMADFVEDDKSNPVAINKKINSNPQPTFSESDVIIPTMENAPTEEKMPPMAGFMPEAQPLAKFKTPESVLNILDSLMRKYPNYASKLKVLKFDVEDDVTPEEVAEKVSRVCTELLIDKSDIDSVLRNLEGDSEQTKNNEIPTEITPPTQTGNGDVPPPPEEPSSAEKINEDDLNFCLEHIKNKFNRPFSFSEFITSFDTLSEDNNFVHTVTDAFNKLLADGKLKSEGYKTYVVVEKVDESVQPEIVEPAQEIPTEIKKEEAIPEPIVTTTPEQDIVVPPMVVAEDVPPAEAVKSPEEIEQELKDARSKYASETIKWKNDVRKKKGVLAKIFSDLGVEKQIPETEKPQELLDAKRIHDEAKKKKIESLFGKSETKTYGKKDGVLGLREGEEYQFNEALLKEVEDDFNKLQNLIKEGMPITETGKIKKAIEILNKKIPPVARIFLLSSIIGVGVGMATGAGVYGAATYGGYRAAKGLVGLAASKGAGVATDKIFGMMNKKSRGQLFSEFAKNVTAENYDEKNTELVTALEKQLGKEKAQAWKKATAMAITGGATSALLGGVWKPSASSAVDSTTGRPKVSVPQEPTVTPKPTVPESTPKITPQTPENAPAPKVAPAELINGTEVKISSKGFIDNFDEMKKTLKLKYPDPAKVPPEFKHIYETNSTKLAQEYGFYKPGQAAESGMAMKGETMGFNTKGQIVHHDLKGNATIIDKDHPFGGKMFDAHQSVKVAVPQEGVKVVEPLPSEVEVEQGLHPQSEIATTEMPTPETPDDFYKVSEPLAPSAEHLDNLTNIKPKVPEAVMHEPFSKNFNINLGAETYHIDIRDNLGNHEVWVNKAQIAKQVSNPSGGGKVMELLDRYQDGKKYAGIRQLFTQARLQEDIFQGLQSPKGGTVTGISFEQGRIDVLHGVGENKNAVDIFLNGKEIAKGLITDKGPKIKLLDSVNHGWFMRQLMADTVYERAFKVASKTIKNMQMMK